MGSYDPGVIRALAATLGPSRDRIEQIAPDVFRHVFELVDTINQLESAACHAREAFSGLRPALTRLARLGMLNPNRERMLRLRIARAERVATGVSRRRRPKGWRRHVRRAKAGLA